MKKKKRNESAVAIPREKSFMKRLGWDMRKNYLLYLMALPALIYFLVYCYAPMFGLVIAFEDYRLGDPILNFNFVGFKYFKRFFESYYFVRLVRNTVMISLEVLVFGTPAAIIFALLMNEVKNVRFKKFAQLATYLPHFISTVVICSLILDFTKIDGLVNTIIQFFGGEAISFMTKPEWFQPVYVISDVWATFGWSSIVYMGALMGINPDLYDSASLDGANRLQKAIYISIPCITPTIVTMVLMNLGHVMTLGFEKVFNLYNPATYETADIIATYVYREGILNANYSSSAAVGMFQSVVNLVLVVAANSLSKRLTDSGLW